MLRKRFCLSEHYSSVGALFHSTQVGQQLHFA